jgi:hypothetical protein
MATTSKSAKTTKSSAAKKPAAKAAPAKAAAKKPAAKKTAVKKPAAKKPAVKKPAAKKPAVKKPAAKKPAVKKPAAKAAPAKKPAAKKPAAKKPAAKAAPAKKPAAPKKPAASKPAVKKPAVKAAPKPDGDPGVPYLNLFEAYAQGKLPFAHGYIVSSFFNEGSAYSIYEIVSYAGVKEIFLTETGLQFVTGGKKLYILVEHDTYALKYQEPTSRKEGERIPKRFSELEIITAKNQTKIMVAKEPNETYGSFTVLRPSGINFSVVFYERPDVYEILSAFFQKSLNTQRKVPQSDARAAAELITKTVVKTMSFKGEFE